MNDLKKDLLDDGKFTDVNNDKIEEAIIQIKDPVALSKSMEDYYRKRGESTPIFQNIEEFIIGFDKRNPSAIYSIPNNSSGVDTRDSLIIEFSETVWTDQGTISKDSDPARINRLVSVEKSQNPTIKIYNYTVSVLENGKKISVRLKNNLDFDQNYTVSLIGIKDLSGNTLSNPTVSFRTQKEEDLKVNTTPVHGTIDAPSLADITVNFSHNAYIKKNPIEKINPNNITGYLCLQKENDGKEVSYTVKQASEKKIIITPNLPLEDETKYIISNCGDFVSEQSQSFPSLRNQFKTKKYTLPTFSVETYKGGSKVEVVSENKKDVISHIDTLKIIFDEYMIDLEGNEITDISKYIKLELNDGNSKSTVQYNISTKKNLDKNEFTVNIGLNISKLPYSKNFTLEISNIKGRSNNPIGKVDFDFTTKSWESISFQGVSGGLDVSPSGSIFLAGSFSGQPIIFEDISLIPTNPSDEIIFLNKLDNHGNILKVTSPFTGTGYKEVRDIKWDANHIYMTGSFSGKIVAGTVSYTSKGQSDIFIAKFNATNLELINLKTYGSTENDTGLNIKISPKSNHIFIGGVCSQVIDLKDDTKTILKGTNNKPGDNNEYKGFILKLDKDLNNVWAFRILFSYDTSNDIFDRKEAKVPFAIGDDDRVYFHATYRQSILFPDKNNTDLTQSGLSKGTDVSGISYTLAIYNANGTFSKYTHFIVNEKTQRAYDILVTSSELFLLGSFESFSVKSSNGVLDLENQTGNSPNISIIRCNIEGEVLGGMVLGTLGEDVPYSFLKDKAGSLTDFFAIGELWGSITLGGTSLGQGDVFDAQIKNDGTLTEFNKLALAAKIKDYYHIVLSNSQIFLLYRNKIEKITKN